MTDRDEVNPPGAERRPSQAMKRVRAVGRALGLRRVYDLITRRKPFRSEAIAIGLRRDLAEPFAAPDARIPIGLRPLEPYDYPVLFNTVDPEIDEDERKLRSARRQLAEAGIGRGYVAVTETGEPCYAQWLFGPADNRGIRRFFEGTFPPLRAGEALLEGAFTPVQHRGKGIMPAAMARIAEHASALDARYVITFVGEDNGASLKGCDRAGFRPYLRRSDRWVGVRRTIRFSPWTGSRPGETVG